MKVLVINAGSSSLKYQLIDMSNEAVLAKGNCERIGIGGSSISQKNADGKSVKVETNFNNHADAFAKLVELITTGDTAVISDLSEIKAVGHRIVQGGRYFSKSVLVTEEVINTLDQISDLAPLHNPVSILALRECKKIFDESVPQVVVFDTAFHQTMPPKAYMFGLPYEYYEKYQVRKYGFHGTSHRFVTARLAEVTGWDMSTKRVITCHLGNGSSIAAVEYGKCIDTSMGFTPLDGLVMGTRAGATDASAVLFIMKQEGLNPDQMNDILNKKSGFLGMSGSTSDSRDLIKAAAEGNHKAQEAIDLFRYEIKKYIGSYAAAMGGVDAIVFTGGIGENSAELRLEVCEGLEYMGIKMDADRNHEFDHNEGRISADDSSAEVWIVPTNEELLIARDTRDLAVK